MPNRFRPVARPGGGSAGEQSSRKKCPYPFFAPPMAYFFVIQRISENELLTGWYIDRLYKKAPKHIPFPFL